MCLGVGIHILGVAVGANVRSVGVGRCECVYMTVCVGVCGCIVGAFLRTGVGRMSVDKYGCG